MYFKSDGAQKQDYREIDMALPLLFLLGTGAKIFSQIQQGRIADAQGRAEQRLAERNALVEEQNAKAREEKARFDQLRHVERGEGILGRLRAALGKSGARLDVGAPIRVLSEQAEELELENLLIGHEGAVEAAQFKERAVISRFKGSLARKRGKAARKTSLLRAFSTTVGAAGTAKSEALFG